MPDYISREAAIDAVDVRNLHRGIIDALQAIISDLPSADVVKVVRCKDCIHRPIYTGRKCGCSIDGPDGDETCPYLCDDGYYNMMPDDDSYCNRGERRRRGCLIT